MADTVERVQALLHEAAETHHQVYRITDGADDDWATWYADWLVRLSELPDLLTKRPVRSQLTHQLVALDEEFARESPAEPWEHFYAERLVQRFG
jgi:hypothetical protein